LHKDYLGINYAIEMYTQHMLNYCPTTNPYEKVTFGTTNDSIPKKPIQ
jgi:hypothetical protein